jgi:hypothetical protein
MAVRRPTRKRGSEATDRLSRRGRGWLKHIWWPWIQFHCHKLIGSLMDVGDSTSVVALVEVGHHKAPRAPLAVLCEGRLLIDTTVVDVSTR